MKRKLGMLITGFGDYYDLSGPKISLDNIMSL